MNDPAPALERPLSPDRVAQPAQRDRRRPAGERTGTAVVKLGKLAEDVDVGLLDDVIRVDRAAYIGRQALDECAAFVA